MYDFWCEGAIIILQFVLLIGTIEISQNTKRDECSHGAREETQCGYPDRIFIVMKQTVYANLVKVKYHCCDEETSAGGDTEQVACSHGRNKSPSHMFEFVTVIHGSHHTLGNSIQYRSIWMVLLVDLFHICLKDLKPRNKRSKMEILDGLHLVLL